MMNTSSTLRVLTWLLILSLWSEIRGISYKSIVWSPENPIFVENKLKCVLPKSRLNIICPSLHVIVADIERAPIKDNLYENVWLVDKAAYDSCNITKQDNNNKRLLVCNTPLVTKYYTIVFQEMSPTVEGLEFEPEKDYFLIATSDRTQKSLGNTEGGHCKARGMKLRFHMCKDSRDPHCLSEEKCQQLLEKTAIQSSPETGKPTEPEVTCNHSTVKPDEKISTSPPIVPNNSLPPNSQYMDTSQEVYYRLGISMLVLMCVSLLAVSAYLGYRLHRKNKQSSYIANTNFEVRKSRISEGADSADGEDSNMLISRMNSNKV